MQLSPFCWRHYVMTGGMNAVQGVGLTDCGVRDNVHAPC